MGEVKLSVAMDYALMDAAISDIGIYPRATVNAKTGEETARTEWQEGWNACAMSIFKTVGRLRDWWKSLEPGIRADLAHLLACDGETDAAANLSVGEDGHVRVWLNISPLVTEKYRKAVTAAIELGVTAAGRPPGLED